MKPEFAPAAPRTTSEAVVDEQSIQTQPVGLVYPEHFQRFDPKGKYPYIVYARSAINEVTKYLNAGEAWKNAEMAAWSPRPPRPLAMAATVDTERLGELLVTEHCSRRCLVAFLPDEMEPLIGDMVSGQPEAVNFNSADLLTSRTLLTFSATQGLSTTSLCLLHDQFCRDEGRSRWPSGEDDFFPVVFVAGNSVAVGGYVCDEYHVGQSQSCSISAQSYMGQERYSEQELGQAAQRAKKTGNWPMLYKLTQIGDNWLGFLAPVHRRPAKKS